MTTSLKTCFKCANEKPRTEFYKHEQMADGLLGKCKDCCRADARSNREKRSAYYREYDRNRGNRQSATDVRRYRSSNPKKAKAHRAVAYAIGVGRLRKMPCEVCGTNQVHAHHDDYTKPLEVRWLCPLHHHQWHATNGEAKTA